MNFYWKYRRYVNVLLIAISLLFSFIGCISRQDFKKKREVVIGFSQCTMENSWRTAMVREMKRELSLYVDFDIEFVLKDANDNSQQQINDIKELQKQGVDILIVSPNEANEVTSVIEDVYESGIPVIVVDRKINSEKYNVFVGADNYKIGQQAGEFTAKYLKGKGELLIIKGLEGSTPAIERQKGFLDAISAYPELIIKEILSANWFENVAYEATDSLINNNLMNFDFIYSHNDFMARGVYRALENNNYELIPIIGIDGLPGSFEGIEMVNSGALLATFLYPNGGTTAIQIAIEILLGKPYKKNIALESIRIDKSNALTMALQSESIAEQQRKIDSQQFHINRMNQLIKRQYSLLIFTSLIIIILLVMGIWIIYLLNQKNKINKKLDTKRDEIANQNELLEQQNEVLEKQIFFITSSIQYAKNIQQAALVQEEKIQKLFQTFIIYYPKDVISGDFYWFHNDKEASYIAVVDCTGHGVPGAFMSMIGINLLKEIIVYRKANEPKDILEYLNNELIDFLRQQKTNNKDGMDICLCKIYRNSNGYKLLFAGAKRPLYYKLDNSNKLVKVKGTRRSIGGFYMKSRTEIPFTQTELIIDSGAMLYLTTDGFAHQINPEGKKFGLKQVEGLFKSVAALQVNDQREKINEAFFSYRKNEPQRDDITIVGVRIDI